MGAFAVGGNKELLAGRPCASTGDGACPERVPNLIGSALDRIALAATGGAKTNPI